MENRVFFFAGGDHKEAGGNAFTANFIQYLTDRFGERFSVIGGIYHSIPLMNVIWALNRAQRPVKQFRRNRILASSFDQIVNDPLTAVSQVVIVSSSYGSVVAAQVACRLAARQEESPFLCRPFHLALGASMVSKESALYLKLVEYQQKGYIGTLIFDDLQDAGDNSNGIGGKNRLEAYLNGLGICFPFLTGKFSGPSFLNNDPVTGHLHRRRAQSVQKARDFMRIIFAEHRLDQ